MAASMGTPTAELMELLSAGKWADLRAGHWDCTTAVRSVHLMAERMADMWGYWTAELRAERTAVNLAEMKAGAMADLTAVLMEQY